MPVNGIELKEGQIWLDASGHKRILSRGNKHPRFPWTGKFLENDEWNTYDNNGLYYGDTPSMIDLVTLISEKEEPVKFNKEVVVLDVYENTYRRGIVVEDGRFLTIEVQTPNSDLRRRYQYPNNDIESGEFIVYVKE